MAHLSAEIIQRYRERRLAPDERLATQMHIGKCADCRARLAGAVAAVSSFTELRADFSARALAEIHHTPARELTLFVRGTLDPVESEIIESHLATCSACEGEARRLRADIRHDANSLAARPVATPENGGWRKRLASLLPSGASWLAPAGATAALALMILAGAWFYRNDFDGEQLATRNAEANRNLAPQASGGNQATNEQGTNQAATNEKVARAEANKNSQPLNVTPEPRRVPGVVPKSNNDNRARPSRPVLVNPSRNENRSLEIDPATQGLEVLASAEQQAVRRSLVTGRLELPDDLRSLKGSTGILLSDPKPSASGASFDLVEPRGRAIESDRPALSWQPLPGARKYTVALTSGNDFRIVERSDDLTGTSWTPTRPLARGIVYTWQVTAYTDDAEIVSPAPPAPAARFKVIGSNESATLNRARASASSSPLTLGILYARYGLLEEAERELTRAAAANPQSRTARKLLANIRALRTSSENRD